MRIEKYGITLHRLTASDLELVRHWRNHPKIRQFMIYQEHITKEMQQQWFKKINNKFNFFFVIEIKGKKIGLIDAKNINYEKKCGESGMFLWDEQFQGTHFTPCISMCISDFGLLLLQIETVYIKVNRNNPKAIQYYKDYGHVLYEDDLSKTYQLYTLSQKDYTKTSDKLKHTLQKMFPAPPQIVLEAHDAGTDYAQLVSSQYKAQLPDIQSLFTLIDESKDNNT